MYTDMDMQVSGLCSTMSTFADGVQETGAAELTYHFASSNRRRRLSMIRWQDVDKTWIRCVRTAVYY
jgi:hypothetical protein